MSMPVMHEGSFYCAVIFAVKRS